MSLCEIFQPMFEDERRAAAVRPAVHLVDGSAGMVAGASSVLLVLGSTDGLLSGGVGVVDAGRILPGAVAEKGRVHWRIRRYK